MAQRRLDFIVIGAQKGGTTSLWRHLQRHPEIATPERKEAPFFSGPEAERPGAWCEYLEAEFDGAPAGALLGKVTPQYMTGSEHADVERIALRVSQALPQVRLIALLRDPIERAASHYGMSLLRGIERRSFEAAIQAQLDSPEARAGRRRATPTNSYVAQGEYGRVLGAYRARFPAEQLHVEMTADLGRDPAGVLDRVLEFLGLPAGFRPPRLDARHHRGGTHKLLDAESHAALFEFMQDNVWPNLGDEAPRVKRLFDAFMAIWNVAPDDERPPIAEATRLRLEEHFRADAEALRGLGIGAPWLDTWRDRRSAG